MKNKFDHIKIYGFGRMGLTHFAILNSLTNSKFTFVDVDWKMNLLTRKNLRANILNSDAKIILRNDFSLICTPPMFHISTLRKCLDRGDKLIFVEKPFGGPNDEIDSRILDSNNIYIGYVMRFNSIVQWIKDNVNPTDVSRIRAHYVSNTIEKKPGGWRNGSYSGVLNEMGSHIIDLCHYLFGLNDAEIINKKLQSVVSNIDDIAEFSLKTSNQEIDMYFN